MYPVLVIPYPALDAAGIDHTSIEVVEISEDRNYPVEHQSRNLDDVPKNGRTVYSHREPCEHGEMDRHVSKVDVGEESISHGYCYGGKSVYVPVQPDDDGFYRWTTQEHELGESLFRATYTERVTNKRPCYGPFDQYQFDQYGEPIYCRHKQRAKHGVQRTVRRSAYFLSGFDRQEAGFRRTNWGGMYFLAQMPAEFDPSEPHMREWDHLEAVPA